LSHTKNPSSFFKRLWSLKEAYFKLNDSITTNRIKELQFDWKKNCFYFNGVSDKSVCRFMYMENKRYCLAIAQSEKEDIEYYDVKYEDTLKMYQKHCSFQSLVPSPMEEI
jgi:phosphopantetheinyl transferase